MASAGAGAGEIRSTENKPTEKRASEPPSHPAKRARGESKSKSKSESMSESESEGKSKSELCMAIAWTTPAFDDHEPDELHSDVKVAPFHALVNWVADILENHSPGVDSLRTSLEDGKEAFWDLHDLYNMRFHLLPSDDEMEKKIVLAAVEKALQSGATGKSAGKKPSSEKGKSKANSCAPVGIMDALAADLVAEFGDASDVKP